MVSIPPLSAPVHPELSTATNQLLQHHTDVEAWLHQQHNILPAPVYSSVDIRHAGFKITPVDTNLFPGGFNNLHDNAIPQCIQAIQHALGTATKKLNKTRAHKIILIPENHTRNLHYFENIAALSNILSKAGYHVRIGSMHPEIQQAKTIQLPSGETITLHPIIHKKSQEKPLKRSQENDQETSKNTNTLTIEGFTPDLILLNHDLSDGNPSMLENLQQAVLPPISMGWSSRTKSNHFKHYADITERFCAEFSLDPWWFTPEHDQCDQLDFQDQASLNLLKRKVDTMLANIQKRYQAHQIAQTPFVAIKANKGTYGMGIMMVQSSDQLDQLNKKQRQKMSASKSGQRVSDVIIQEGVPTIESWHDSVAEPVIYAIGFDVVGSFYRIHNHKGRDENLNSPGMAFRPLPCPLACNNPSKDFKDPINRFYLYGVITRLAILAAAREQQEMT